MSDFEPEFLSIGEIRFLDRKGHENERLTVDVARYDHGIFSVSENLNDETGDADRVLLIWPQDIPAVIKSLTAAYNWLSDTPYNEEDVK